MKDFEIKREAALQLLQDTGIRKANYCPPVLRLLWRLGFKVPPPHFCNFASTALFCGGLFAVGWGSLMWLIVWRSAGMTPVQAVGASVAAGALLGIAMGVYYAYGRIQHSLPAWRSLGPDGGASAAR